MALLYIPTSKQDFPKLKGFGCGSDIALFAWLKSHD
jgi:hypothetical protein